MQARRLRKISREESREKRTLKEHRAGREKRTGIRD
jgi:hypothetical protein